MLLFVFIFKRYAHSARPKLGGLDDGRAGGGEGFGSDLSESGGDVDRSGCPLAPLDSWGYIKGIQGGGHVEDPFFEFGTLFSVRFWEGEYLWGDRGHPKKETDLLGRTTFYRLEG